MNLIPAATPLKRNERRTILSFAKLISRFQKRGVQKTLKEILAPSNTCFSNEDQPQNENEHVDEVNGSHPCNKPCMYCNILRKTESNQFKSNSNGQTFNIRQNIDCQSENVVYLIWCKECKLQGVGRTLKMSKRLSNYYSHIKQNIEHVLPSVTS